MARACAYPAIRHLVLWLTTGCNLSCAYCYRGAPERSVVMPRPTAMAALDLANQGGRPFHVQMAGGEPCLEPSLIEAIAARVRSADMPATIAVQTNGTLITRPLAEMFRRWDITVGVSMDGPPAQHELLRGRYAETLRGLEHLERAGVRFGVTAVVCAENVSQMPSLAMLLSNYKYAHGLGLDLLVRRGRAARGEPAMAEANTLTKAMVELAQTVVWINRRRHSPLVLREMDRLRNGQRAFCHAAVGSSLAVHPDGSLYPCGQTMGDPDLALGTIDKPDFSRIRGLGRYELPAADCGGCPLEGHCPGECPSRLKYNGPEGRELACALLRGLTLGYGRQTPRTTASMEQTHATA